MKRLLTFCSADRSGRAGASAALFAATLLAAACANDPRAPGPTTGDTGQLARLQDSPIVQKQLETLRTSGWELESMATAPIDTFMGPETVELDPQQKGLQTMWTRLTMAATRKDSNGRIVGRANIVIGWTSDREPQLVVQPIDDGSRALMHADIDGRATDPSDVSSSVEQRTMALEADDESSSVETVDSAGEVAALACAGRNDACGSRSCCRGFKCKYSGSTLACGCDRSDRSCTFVSKFGALHPLCTSTSLGAYYQKRKLVGCLNGDALVPNACGQGIFCPASRHSDTTLTFCGVRHGC